MKILLIGSGNMAREYVKALSYMGQDYDVICRSHSSAKKFKKDTGKSPVVMSLSELSTVYDINSPIINAISIDALADVTNNLLKQGFKSILVEKPGALRANEITDSMLRSKVKIAYNRRFYSSVMFLKSIKDKIKSCHFEVTEWSHIIENTHHNKQVKKFWMSANSSHVIDLAFFLIGFPETISINVDGKNEVNWHENSSFCGSGRTLDNKIFTYYGYWNSAGRWRAEFFTDEGKYYLEPLEKLFFQKKGTLELEPVKLSCKLDEICKPGLIEMLSSFLNGGTNLPNYKEQKKLLTIVERMAGYK